MLRLTLNGDESAFDETKAPEDQRRLVAVTEGAGDFAELRQRIAAETAATHAIYRRIVEEPARGGDRRSEA
jgi:[glutamine synthetase] adenylyltransferase / [glutamine synthetase]-adenylyl-L-tyrosine phosphorylase